MCSNCNDDIQLQMKNSLSNCPVRIIDKSIEQLKRILTLENIEYIKQQYKLDSDFWWTKNNFHFDAGMKIRNFLRKEVCLDNKLPTGNWDDLYIQMIELACELRSL